MSKKAIQNLVFVVGLLVLSFSAWAEGPAVPAGSAPVPGASGQPQQPGLLGMLVPFAAMFGVIYFLMIRPQQKRLREQQNMLSALKEGDEVLTASGILGKVTGMTEKVVTVEIADKVRVKMLKSQVQQVIKGSIKDIVQ